MGAAMRHTSLFCGKRGAFKLAPSECVHSGKFLADNELMHRFGTFIGDDALEVQHVTNRYVLCTDTRPAEDIAGISSDIDGGAAIVPLRQRDLRRT